MQLVDVLQIKCVRTMHLWQSGKIMKEDVIAACIAYAAERGITGTFCYVVIAKCHLFCNF
jgi:hypothetical protein